MKTIKGLNLTIDIDELRPILEKEGYELVKKEPEPEFKVGDWVKFINPPNEKGIDVVFRINEIQVNYCLSDEGKLYRIKYCRLAKPEQIEQHLRKIAEEKGFKKGVRFKSINEDELGKIRTIEEIYPYHENTLDYDKEDDAVRVVTPQNEWDEFCSNPSIYGKGVWAEIVEDKKKLPRTKDEFEEFMNEWFNWDNTLPNFLEQYED